MYTNPNNSIRTEPVILIDLSEVIGETKSYFPKEVVQFFKDTLPNDGKDSFMHLRAAWEPQQSPSGNLANSPSLSLKESNEFLKNLKLIAARITEGPTTTIISLPDVAEFSRAFETLVVNKTTTMISQSVAIILSKMWENTSRDSAIDLLLKFGKYGTSGNKQLVAIETLLPILLFIWVESAKLGRSFLFCPKITKSRELTALTYLQERSKSFGGIQVTPSSTGERKLQRYQQDSLFIESAPLELARAQQFVFTITGRQVLNIGPKVGDKPANRYIESIPFSPDWESFSINPKNIEYDLWCIEEFGSRRVARSFLDAAITAFANSSSSVRKMLNEKTGLLPIEIINAYAATRFSRRMSTWTLEGTSFRCNIVLLDKVKLKNLGAGTPRFHPLINLEPPIPLNFLHEDQLRNHAELAQGDGLFLVANASDGKVHHICSEAEIAKHSRYRRIKVLSELVSHSGLLLHIHAPSSIEMYSPSGLSLWWDGFEWKNRPIEDLEQALNTHFAKPSLIEEWRVTETETVNLGSSRNKPELVTTMIDVVGRLMDRCESSIIVFIDPRDSERLFQLAGEQLRDGWHWSTANVEIQLLSPEALTGLMHVDGTQVVDSQGNIIAVARRIQVSLPRYIVKMEAREADEVSKYLEKKQQFDVFSVSKSEIDKSEKKLLIKRFFSIQQVNQSGLTSSVITKWVSEIIAETTPFVASDGILSVKNEERLKRMILKYPFLVSFKFVDVDKKCRIGLLEFHLDNDTRKEDEPFLTLEESDQKFIRETFPVVDDNPLFRTATRNKKANKQKGVFVQVVEDLEKVQVDQPERGWINVYRSNNEIHRYKYIDSEISEQNESERSRERRLRLFSLEKMKGTANPKSTKFRLQDSKCDFREFGLIAGDFVYHVDSEKFVKIKEVHDEHTLITEHLGSDTWKGKRFVLNLLVQNYDDNLKVDIEGFVPAHRRKRCYVLTVNQELISLPERSLLEENRFSTGVGFDGEKNWIVLEGKLNEVVFGDLSDSPMPTMVREQFRMLLERSKDSRGNSSGTGTRVAKRLSKGLPNSLVVKVSASGKLYILRGLSFDKS